MYFAVNLIIFIFEPLPVYFLDNRSRFMKLRITDNGCERARSKIKSIVQTLVSSDGRHEVAQCSRIGIIYRTLAMTL